MRVNSKGVISIVNLHSVLIHDSEKRVVILSELKVVLVSVHENVITVG